MSQLFQQTLSALFTAGTQQKDTDLSRPVLSPPGSPGIATVADWGPRCLMTRCHQELLLSATEAKHSTSSPAQREMFSHVLSCHLGLVYGFRSSRLRACPRKGLNTNRTLDMGFMGMCSIWETSVDSISPHRATVPNHSSGAQGMRAWSFPARNTTPVWRTPIPSP